MPAYLMWPQCRHAQKTIFFPKYILQNSISGMAENIISLQMMDGLHSVRYVNFLSIRSAQI